MPRYNSGIEEIVRGTSKIRKRASSSPSASSSLLQNYRFKRAIMVGKKGGSTTPAPNWRMNPKSPSASSKVSDSSRQQGPVSARKLANALWELNKIPSPQFSENLPIRRSKKISKSLAHRLSDPSHSPESERGNRTRSSAYTRIMPMVSHRVRSKEHNHRALDLLSSASLMEIDTGSQGLTPTSSIMGTKICLKNLRNGLTSSKELVKLLSRIWGVEEQNSYVISLFSVLRVELDRARSQIDQLIQEQRFLDEKSSSTIKEQERIKSAIHSIMEELESEKKSRRRAERLNKKLGLELADTRETLSKAVKELESEKRSREIIEHICNEVVKGIGEDKAEVEYIKRESTKIREELEKEREMLHIADEWREERVHMKLLEAKVQFEEKNAAVDQLRNELEVFLENNRKATNYEESQTEGRISVESDHENNSKTNYEENQAKGRISVESDLHSIELNFESNKGEDIEYLDKSSSLVEEKDEELDEDVERYVSVKKLRENMLAGTKIFLPRALPSPTRQWNRNRVSEGSKVAKIVKAIKGGTGASVLS